MPFYPKAADVRCAKGPIGENETRTLERSQARGVF